MVAPSSSAGPRRSSPVDRLRERLASDAASPLVTFYDDATGERVELSGATFDNWVAKTANLLQDSLGAGAGTRVGLLLPLHWQTAVWQLACWSVGALVVPGSTDADVVVTGPDGLSAALEATPDELVALSLAPFGAPLADLPPGVLDYATEVPGHGDRFAPVDRPGPGTPAVELAGRAWTHADLDDAAGLEPGDTLLTLLDPGSSPGLQLLAAAPLAAGGRAVLVRNPSAAPIVSRIGAERVTVAAGLDAVGAAGAAAPAVRRLAG